MAGNTAMQRAALLREKGADFVLEERSIPVPGPGEVVVRNRVVALNPIDWKRQEWGFMVPSYPAVLGSELCGEVHKVGDGVTDFKPGDRVFGSAHGFMSGNPDNAAFQEYSVIKATVTSSLPKSITDYQAATVVTSAVTASMVLFDALNLPRPHSGAKKNGETGLIYPSAILIWGGGSSVGSMAIQLARLAGLTVIATASSKHHNYLRELGANAVVDYKSPTAVEEILDAAKNAGTSISLALDVISGEQTLPQVAEVLQKAKGQSAPILASVTPWPEQVPKPDGITLKTVTGGDIWNRREDLAKWLFHETLPVWLENGSVVPGRYRIIEGGLGGIQSGLRQLKEGVSGEKLLVEVR